MQEIERKFLLPPCKAKKYLKKLGVTYTKKHIIQYYAKNMRLRKIDNRYFRTIKSGQGLVRQEIEEPMSKADFYAFINQKDGEIIEKYRYIFAYKSHTYEMDVFKRHLKGLIYLEIEFDSLEEAKNFILPKKIAKFILDEVTNNPSFTNRFLALEGLPSLDTPLEKLKANIQTKDPLSATLRLQFHPFENIYGVLGIWVSSLADVIEANKQAILENDPNRERLHQLRVALRKLRSVLTLLAKYLEITETKELIKLAKNFMKHTNEARDLDVYLEWLKQYENEILPKNLSQNLHTIQEHLKKKRQKAYERLKKSLQSKEFALLLDELRAFGTDEPDKKMPAIIVGKRVVVKQLQKILKKADALSSKSAPHKYHLVRIEIKKLRYLLEFFAPVFDQKKFTKIIAHIKQLQNILGEHQDTLVQIEYLEHFQNLSTKEQEALEFLFTYLKHKAKNLRKKFRKRIPLSLHPQLKSALCRA